MPSEKSFNDEDGRSRGLVRRAFQVAASLQCKATLLVVALTLTITAGVSGYLLHTSARLARHEQKERLSDIAAMLARAASTVISQGGQLRLKELAREVTDGGPLEYVIFTDVEGRELAAAERKPGILKNHKTGFAGRDLIPGTPLTHLSPGRQPACIDITYPMNTRSASEKSVSLRTVNLLGYLRAGMLADGWHKSMASTMDFVTGVGVLAVVVAIPAGFLLIRRIVAPLEGLAEAMLRFSRGELNVRSPHHRRDEIGRLAGAFNLMADQHQQTHERIVKLNSELEKRVATRTRQLRELAVREPLTGLYNRRHFAEVLERAFAEATRYHNDLACLMLDLDDFKKVNDTRGHQIGDDLLLFLAKTIQSQLRAADVPARFGGDEFIVLLPQTSVDRGYVLGERIVEKFVREAAQYFPAVQIGLSVGVAGLRSEGVADVESLIRCVDRALYEAKKSGTNLVVAARDGATPAEL